jgi:hypothetical protein
MQSSNVPNRGVRTLRFWNIDVFAHLNFFRFSGSAFCDFRRSTLAALFLVVAFLRAAYSAPPDFAQIPADTAWIVHVDFDALHKSTVYQKVSTAALAGWKPLADRLAKINRQLGMDVAKDLHGMTVFASTLAEPKPLLLMQADWDPQTFRQRLALAPSHAVSTAGQYEIHRFVRKDEGQLRSLAGTCWRPGTFLFGQTPEDVQRALEVLDGRRPHLAGHDSALAADISPGTVLTARMVLSGEKLPVESPLLKKTEQIDLACGENSGECFARARLLAKTAEAAVQVKKAAEGILAIVKLNVPGESSAAKMLDRLAIRVDGRTVLVDFRIPSTELTTALEKAMRKGEAAGAK